MSNESPLAEPTPDQLKAMLQGAARKRLEAADAELARLPGFIDAIVQIADSSCKLVARNDEHVRDARKWIGKVEDLHYELNRLDGVSRHLFAFSGGGSGTFYRPAWWLLGLGQHTAREWVYEASETLMRLNAVVTGAARIRGIIAPGVKPTEADLVELDSMVAEDAICTLPQPKRVEAAGVRPETTSVETEVAKPVSDPQVIMRKVLLALGDKNAGKIMTIAQAVDLTVDQKQRAIAKLDRTVSAWKSTKWAELFGTSSQACRDTPWWNEERKHMLRG